MNSRQKIFDNYTHPNEVGETYVQHGLSAMRYSLTFLFLFVIAFSSCYITFSV